MADLQKLGEELLALRKAHRKLMQEAADSGATTLSETVKVSAKKIQVLEQLLLLELETIRSSAPETPEGAMREAPYDPEEAND